MCARGAKRRSTATGLLAAVGALTLFLAPLAAAPALAAPACAPRDFDGLGNRLENSRPFGTQVSGVTATIGSRGLAHRN